MPKPKRDLCHLWPACSCGDRLTHFATSPIEHPEFAEPIIEASLACAAERCPDPAVRQHATVQLIKIQTSPNYRREYRAAGGLN